MNHLLIFIIYITEEFFNLIVCSAEEDNTFKGAILKLKSKNIDWLQCHLIAMLSIVNMRVDGTFKQ
jgi:hypothetical protein